MLKKFFSCISEMFGRGMMLLQIISVLNEHKWDVIIAPRKDFLELLNLKEPGTSFEMSIEGEEGEFPIDLAPEDFNFPQMPDPSMIAHTNSNTISKPPQMTSQDGLDFALGSVENTLPEGIYNFASIYLSGSRLYNVATLFSVAADYSLFTEEQRQFTLKTYTDVIDLVNELKEEFHLDAVLFVETDVAKKIVPYVEKAVDNIKVISIKEYFDFSSQVHNLIPMMSNGYIYVSYAPWMVTLQNELQQFTMMSMMGKRPVSSGGIFARLRSFAYGVSFWDNEKDTDTFVRDFGINETES